MTASGARAEVLALGPWLDVRTFERRLQRGVHRIDPFLAELIRGDGLLDDR